MDHINWEHFGARPYSTSGNAQEHIVQAMNTESIQRHNILGRHTISYTLDNSKIKKPVLKVVFDGRDSGYYVEQTSTSDILFALYNSSKNKVYSFARFHGIQEVIAFYVVPGFKGLMAQSIQGKQFGKYVGQVHGDQVKLFDGSKDTGYKLEFRCSDKHVENKINHGFALLNSKGKELNRYNSFMNDWKTEDDIVAKIGAKK